MPPPRFRGCGWSQGLSHPIIGHNWDYLPARMELELPDPEQWLSGPGSFSIQMFTLVCPLSQEFTAILSLSLSLSFFVFLGCKPGTAPELLTDDVDEPPYALKSGLITQIPARSPVCRIPAVKSAPPTAAVFSGLLFCELVDHFPAKSPFKLPFYVVCLS